MNTRIAASADSGMYFSVNGSAETNNNSHTPCIMAEARVTAPASTLAPERTMTPVIGSTPRKPQMVLPTPCAVSSRSYLVRGPLCI